MKFLVWKKEYKWALLEIFEHVTANFPCFVLWTKMINTIMIQLYTRSRGAKFINQELCKWTIFRTPVEIGFSLALKTKGGEVIALSDVPQGIFLRKQSRELGMFRNYSATSRQYSFNNNSIEWFYVYEYRSTTVLEKETV